MEGDAEIVPQSLREKALFYTTAFFVLLGTFSLFAFLFLVPFVIDPAFTTIFMQFEPRPAQCVTSEVVVKRGTKNCTWASCREGCTREVYNCTQIRVDYRITPLKRLPAAPSDGDEEDEGTTPLPAEGAPSELNEWSVGVASRMAASRPSPAAASEADASSGAVEWTADWMQRSSPHKLNKRDVTIVPLMNDTSEWFFTGAKLFPNVKGCGYPPMLNCSIFLWAHQTVGTNFTCYYSRVDPMLVMSDLDMKQVYLNLVLATAIPIPSFIISVIYLAFAYFVIYAEEESADPESMVPPLGDAEDKDNLDADADTELQERKLLPPDDELIDADDRSPTDPDDLVEFADKSPTSATAADDDNDQQADRLPDKQPTPVESAPLNAAGDSTKPQSMMVVRPTTLQPSGPIAAV
ncbi:protein tipE isoform X2 [Cloeon dipterum]|uniref:protein tipE isoform X2 n=1 Tax=Cloeon dipterum TaxID=197152 RepID=UPI0032209BE8